MRRRVPWLAVMSALLAAPLLMAATLTVDDDGPADHPSIQSAINAAGPGDTILVSPGRYRETLSFLGKSVTVESTHGPGATTVFLEGETRIVTLDGSSTLRGFTITGGRARVGAGIRISGTGIQPVVEGNVIEGNTAQWDGVGLALGGGIAVEGSAEPVIRDNIIRGNSALGDGTGYYAYGAGIDVGDGTSGTIENNVIVDNTATDTGGAISIGLVDTVPLVVRNNTIAGNRAGTAPNTFSYGGGISVYSGSEVVLRNNAITGNEAGFEGGGIYFFANNLNGIDYDSNDFDANLPDDCSGVSSNACSGGQLFLAPAYLDPDGGDYRLRSDSALIDAGSTTSPPAADADGRPRNVDGDLDGAAAPDVGAYENQKELTRLGFTDDTTLTWDGSANASMDFDLYRDPLSGLAPGTVGSCLQSGLASPTTSDGATPPTADGFLYLVRGMDAVVGSLGFDGAGAERVPTSACP